MSNPHDYKIPTPSKAYFKDTHTMVLVSFFPRSGSSLLGYLLTAHRNMIIANEPAKKEENLYDKVPINVLLNYILYIDQIRRKEAELTQHSQKPEKFSSPDTTTERIYNQKDRYVIVPNQWQASCESLQVIGIKNSLPLAETLATEDTLQKLMENLKKIGIRRLKFIFTVRNPYDMIATDVIYWAKNKRLRTVTPNDINKILDYKVRISFPDMCKASAKIFELMKPNRLIFPTTSNKNIFLNRHEDVVASPTKQLSKLCKFLKVPVTRDYLDDCASVIRKNANKSRYELDWSDEQKEEVAKIIRKYDFFSNYSWDA